MLRESRRTSRVEKNFFPFFCDMCRKSHVLHIAADIAPITAVDVAKMSPSDVFIGWNSTMKPSGDYDVTWCRVGKCNERSVQTSEIHLTDLEASSTYTVEIVLHRGNFKAHIFRGTMQTLVRGWLAGAIGVRLFFLCL